MPTMTVAIAISCPARRAVDGRGPELQARSSPDAGWLWLIRAE